MASLKPPFTLQTAAKKVKAAQNLWNTKFALSPSFKHYPTPLSNHPFTIHKRYHENRICLHPRYHLEEPLHILDWHIRCNQLPRREVPKRAVVPSPQRAVCIHGEPHRRTILVRVPGCRGWPEVEAVLWAGGLDVQ